MTVLTRHTTDDFSVKCKQRIINILLYLNLFKEDIMYFVPRQFGEVTNIRIKDIS